MKKVTAILLLLLYATASLGVPVNAHYCEGQLISTQLAVFSEIKCSHTTGPNCAMNCSEQALFCPTVVHSFQSDPPTGPAFPFVQPAKLVHYFQVALFAPPTGQRLAPYHIPDSFSTHDILSLTRTLRI